MKRIIIFSVAIILLARAASVSASQPVPPTNCIDNPVNHGAYVSCIARQHLGGAVTSQAAQSNIGKMNGSDVTPTVSPTIAPTIVPTVTPTETVTPTVTPTETVTPTVTPSITDTPTITPTETITPTITPTAATDTNSNNATIASEIKSLLDQIKSLIGSFIYLPNY